MATARIYYTLRLLILLWLFGTAHGFGQEPGPVKSTLARVQEALPVSWTLDVHVDHPVNVFHPEQGNVTRVMRATVSNDVAAVVWKTPDLPPPTYYAADTANHSSRHHDSDGNLLLSMWSERATFRNPSLHKEYSMTIGFLTAPDGTVLRRTSGASLDRRRPSDTNTISWNLLRRVLWALGRPTADALGIQLSEEENGDGTKRLRAAGGWGDSPSFGECELLVEPANGYLVRRASFVADGEPRGEECRTEGSRRFGDVVLGERGEFRMPVETIMVRLVAFSPELDVNLIAEARQMTSTARTGTIQVFDYRGDPVTPTVRQIPVEELED